MSIAKREKEIKLMNGLPMLIAMREQEEKLAKQNKKETKKKPNKKQKKEKD